MRMKVVCSYKQPVTDGVHLHFSPVVSGSKENELFFRYTPGGTIALHTTNTAVAAQFEQGKEYYVDFTAAADADARRDVNQEARPGHDQVIGG